MIERKENGQEEEIISHILIPINLFCFRIYNENKNHFVAYSYAANGILAIILLIVAFVLLY